MNEHHVGCIDITFGLNDTTLASAASARAQVAFLNSNGLDANTARRRIHGDHATLLAAIRPSHDLNEVALPNLLHPKFASRERLGIRQTKAFVKVPLGKNGEFPNCFEPQGASIRRLLPDAPAVSSRRTQERCE